MVMNSGIVTSRTSLSLVSVSRWPVRRWVRRRNDATERSRTSSLVSAVTSVSRPRRFSAVGRVVGFAAGAGRAAPAPAPAPPRRGRGASSSSASSAGRGPGGRRLGVAAGVVVVSPPKCFLTTSSALRLVSRSCLRRFSSSALRASAASRSVRSISSRAFWMRASSSAILRSSASRSRASPSARARAVRSSSVSVRSTTPDGFGAGAGAGAAAAGAAAGAAALPAAGRARWRRSCRRGGLAVHAALHLLDHHRLGAAVTEALAHDALLDAASLQRQGLRGVHAQLLFPSLFRRFGHYSLILGRRQRRLPRTRS